MDFSDNFHNIENFVQVAHLEFFLKNLFIFSVFSYAYVRALSDVW
jgi:hypothetical protein